MNNEVWNEKFWRVQELAGCRGKERLPPCTHAASTRASTTARAPPASYRQRDSNGAGGRWSGGSTARRRPAGHGQADDQAAFIFLLAPTGPCRSDAGTWAHSRVGWQRHETHGDVAWPGAEQPTRSMSGACALCSAPSPWRILLPAHATRHGQSTWLLRGQQATPPSPCLEPLVSSLGLSLSSDQHSSKKNEVGKFTETVNAHHL